MIRMPAPTLIAATAILLLAACDTSPVAPLPDISGTYSLVAVDGDPLPTVLHEDENRRIEVVSGTLILSAADTYSEPVTVRFTDKVSGFSESVVETDNGSFTLTSATTVTFTPDDSRFDSYSGTIDGNEITYIAGELQVTYRR